MVVPSPDKILLTGFKTRLKVAGTEAELQPFCQYAAKLGLKEGATPLILKGDKSLPEEAWTLEADKDACVLLAKGHRGFQRGLGALLQLLAGNDGQVPCGRYESAPSCPFRCVMLDLARNFHPLPVLFQYLDMCWLFGLPYLHLHFTDNESYTLPSETYPKLATYGRSYSLNDIKSLNDYALARGIEIVPEIDVPGHCRCFCSAYGEIFGQGKVVSQEEKSLSAIESLFDELCGLFPDSRFIHIGGDESGMPEVPLAKFVSRMARAVLAKGRRPMAWEGFSKNVNSLIPKELLVSSWENYYQTTPKLLEGGFQILNSSWRPMYVVTPKFYWSLEEIYSWSIYNWRATMPESPYYEKGLEIAPTSQVAGGELLAWGDYIPTSFATVSEGILEEQRLMEERAAILSERTWNAEAKMSFADFSKTLRPALALLQKIKSRQQSL